MFIDVFDFEIKHNTIVVYIQHFNLHKFYVAYFRSDGSIEIWSLKDDWYQEAVRLYTLNVQHIWH